MLPRRTARYVNKGHRLLQTCYGWWTGALRQYAGGAYLVNILSPGQLLGTRNAGAAWVGSPFGPAIYCTGGAHVDMPWPAISTIQRYTLRIVAYPISYPSGFTTFFGDAAQNWLVDLNTSGNASFSGNMTGIGGSEGMTTGSWWDYVFTRDPLGGGNTGKTYVNGALKNAGNGGISVAAAATMQFGCLQGGGANWNGYYADIMFWLDHALSDAEVYALYRESRAGYPNLLPRRRSVLLVPAGGGTTYNVSISESATATDTVTDTAILGSSVTEAATAADSPAAAAVFASSISESATATDAPTSAAVFASSVTEAATATDSVSGGLLFTCAVTEAANASDAITVAAAFASALTENASAADNGSCTGVFGGSMTEPCTATDTVTVSAIFPVTVSEAATALDTVTLPNLNTATVPVWTEDARPLTWKEAARPLTWTEDTRPTTIANGDKMNAKQRPGADRTYTIDMSGYGEIAAGQTITSVGAATAVPYETAKADTSPLTLGAPAVVNTGTLTGKAITIPITGGGTDGITYLVYAHCTFSGGGGDDAEIAVEVTRRPLGTV